MSADAGAAWTCPFCPLACDHVGVRVDGGALALVGDRCARAEAALAGFGAAARPLVDGHEVTLDEAVAAAARLLGQARQPLMAGLGCDVAGARALYPLAVATGAVADSAGGDAFAEGLRALQDRGQFTTTLAEVRTRADLLVLVGPPPLAAAPLLLRRLGLTETLPRHVVTLGAAAPDFTGVSPAVTHEAVAEGADLFDTLSQLAVAVARPGAAVPPALAALAGRLRQARYAVLVGAPPLLPAPAALLMERVHAVVHRLNRSTRAAALWVGGGNGAATANQVFAWLSGLPLRSRAGPHGLEHEPRLFGADRLLADGAADALLWVSAFEAGLRPPATTLPLVGLAHPGQAEAFRRAGAVFIPVATPGVGQAGHLFRTDGTVLMPLAAVRADALPGVAEVATKIHAALTSKVSA